MIQIKYKLKMEVFYEKVISVLFLIISTFLFANIKFIDDVGREIILEKPLTRVVVATDIFELIRAIGAIDSVIAVDTNTAQDRVY